MALSNKEIIQRLQGVPREFVVAFVARCALRVLPLLAANDRDEPFGYWSDSNRATHLLAVLRALNLAMIQHQVIKV